MNANFDNITEILERIIVTSPEVKKPVALRYCFRNFQLGNLANAGGLPLFPFRTDNWE